jgi:anti-sigma B factor antagonist
MHGIDIKVSYVGNDKEVAIIDINGYIDTTTAPEVYKVIMEQLTLNKYKIIVNLEQVPYISSVGWGTFVGDLKDIRDKNGDLVLANMTYDIYNIFELMEFSSIINSFTGVDSAVSYFLGTDAVKTQADVIKEFIRAEKDTKTEQSSSPDQIPPPEEPTPYVQTPESNTASTTNEKPSSMLFSLGKTGYDVNQLLSATRTELGKNILRVIIDKPYYDVKDIVKALSFSQYGGIRVRKGEVKRELKYMGLDDRQKRYELALKTKSR